MSKIALSFDALTVDTFDMGGDPVAALAIATRETEEGTSGGGCTVWTTCSPGCDTTGSC
jgi:selenophosphate synthase